ncbi:1-deoxy-D-xylulose-5-phosphate reductoisomerase [Clostridia bacterium]|nr:1-deoxy-D-xylulose-5-phosphate reductoisomerase [Clostridia bacterium]
MEKIAVLGSTGSIGTQTLDVLRAHPDSFEVSLLAAGSNLTSLLNQIEEFKPQFVYLDNVIKKEELKEVLEDKNATILNSKEELNQALGSDSVDTVVAAIGGFAGLSSVWASLVAGKKIALANKESLVTAGTLIMDFVKKNQCILKPVDSEHSAIFQCIENTQRQVEKIILTASGGAFRDLPREEFKNITLEKALHHPNWSMGKKITIDSSTLANKGLEMIEASHLFSLEYKAIDVLVHRQSIVHSMAQFIDGSVLAQMGLPDMRLPIQYALSSPRSLPSDFERLDLAKIGSLSFEEPRIKDFPALRLAYQTDKNKGCGGLCYNAGNEVGVDLFLNERISFVEIPSFIEKAMERFMHQNIESIDHIFEMDREIRDYLYGWHERKLK